MMEFRTMDPALRRQLIDSQKDILTPLAKKQPPTIQRCPKCGTEMIGQRPQELSGILPKFDFKCPNCGVLVVGSTGAVIT